jgi:hypothetical protein
VTGSTVSRFLHMYYMVLPKLSVAVTEILIKTTVSASSLLVLHCSESDIL